MCNASQYLFWWPCWWAGALVTGWARASNLAALPSANSIKPSPMPMAGSKLLTLHVQTQQLRPRPRPAERASAIKPLLRCVR